MSDTAISTAPARTGLSGLELVAIAVFVLALLARLWLALSLDLDGDEAYYAFWAAWPSLAYLDHPPGVALSIWAGETLFGPTLLGVRAFALVAQVLVVVALYRTTRLLVPGRSAAAVAVIWYSLTLTVAISFVATPDAPSVLFWTLATWAAAEAVARSRPSWWLAVGLFAGLGLVSKYTNAWLGIGLVAFLLLSRDGRRQLMTWQLWAGGLFALVVFSPVLWYNATHDWRPFLFQGRRVVSFDAPLGAFVGEFIASQALLVGPILMVCSLVGAAAWVLGRSNRSGASLALPVLTSLPLLAYFLFHSLHARVEANWPQPVLPMLTLVAAWAVTAIRRPVLRNSAIILQSALGAVLIGLLCWVAIFQPFDLGSADRTRMLRGWNSMSAEVRQIADAHGARSIFTDGNYRLSGELFFYGQAAGDPRPVRNISSLERYDYIPAPERVPQAFPAAFVREGNKPPTEYFGKVETAGTVTRLTGTKAQEIYTVFIVSEPTAAFPTVN